MHGGPKTIIIVDLIGNYSHSQEKVSKYRQAQVKNWILNIPTCARITGLVTVKCRYHIYIDPDRNGITVKVVRNKETEVDLGYENVVTEINEGRHWKWDADMW